MSLNASFPFALNITDFCPNVNGVMNGSVPIRYALKGLTVQTAINLYTKAFDMDVSGNTGLPIGGFMWDLQNEIARRGQFQFNYTLVSEPPETMDMSEWILKVVSHVDIYANTWYEDTFQRRMMGIGFFDQIVDSSSILVTLQTDISSPPDWWSFLAPFTNELWFYIAITILFNGVIHSLFEAHESHTLYDIIAGILKSVTRSAQTFVGGGGGLIAGNGLSAPLLLLYTFWVLILMASYTANLATLLIQQPQSSLPVQSIDDANMRQLRICALADTTQFMVLKQNYPRIKAVPVPGYTNVELMAALRSGQCVAAVIANADLQPAVLSKSTNPGCQLVQAGPIFQAMSGSWAYFHHDFAGKHCTFLLESTISDIVIQMQNDGTYHRIYEAALAEINDGGCSLDEAPAALNLQLDTADLAGVFIVYIFCVGFAFFVRLIENYKARIWAYTRGHFVKPYSSKVAVCPSGNPLERRFDTKEGIYAVEEQEQEDLVDINTSATSTQLNHQLRGKRARKLAHRAKAVQARLAIASAAVAAPAAASSDNEHRSLAHEEDDNDDDDDDDVEKVKEMKNETMCNDLMNEVERLRESNAALKAALQQAEKENAALRGRHEGPGVPWLEPTSPVQILPSELQNIDEEQNAALWGRSEGLGGRSLESATSSAQNHPQPTSCPIALKIHHVDDDISHFV